MFIGTMALVVYLFYQYIAILVQEETGKTRLLDTAARMFLVVAEIGVNFLAYLTNIRMEQAKKLLLSTPLSIAEVSERSGYGNYRVSDPVREDPPDRFGIPVNPTMLAS